MTDQEFQVLISRLHKLSADDGDVGHEYWTLVIGQLRTMRKQALTSNMRPTQWSTTIEDAGDGSGDGMLLLPDDLVEQLGWKEGDVLAISPTDSGKIVIRRIVK
jgi:hypothetical protein